MKIPLVDLQVQTSALRNELLNAVSEVMDSCQFIQGPFVERFEEDFLALHGGEFAAGCSNGTSAITLVLRALGIGRNDEVLIPNNTFIGTAEPVVESGAMPIFVDIERESYRLSLVDLERKKSSKTKALIAVHLYGLSENIEVLKDWCEANEIFLIEDCAQSHLCRFSDRPVGTFGVAGTFSFYPGKNLGALGDAGLVISNNRELIEKVKMWADHGRRKKYFHEFSAGNYRMDALQASILSVKLRYLTEWTNRRVEVAREYDRILSKMGFKLLKPIPSSSPVYHLYVIEVSNREQVRQAFKNAGVASGIHYPVPLNCQPAFQQYGYQKGQFEVSEYVADRIISLPIFPELEKTEIAYVCDILSKEATP